MRHSRHAAGILFAKSPAAKSGFRIMRASAVPELPIRIKRYPNRRFYASHNSSYVSLAEIEALVRSGKDVEIVDSQSGDDITRAVLVQMIAERHPDKMAMFPAAMLHAMLRANEVMTGFLQDYFRNSLSYLDYLAQHGSSGSLRQPVHWMKAWLENWSKPTHDVESALVETAAGDATTVGSPIADRMQQLEERIAQLEKEREEKS
jgi:polyhydroxyalkanoate synthesis repressor PhaR